MPVEDFARDVKHMTRGLRKSPGFTLAVILTLALGIGANTAIFSVVDQLLLRPLPYPNGDELVTIYETLHDRGLLEPTIGRTRNIVSPANWLDWQRDSRTLSQLAAWRSGTATLTGVGSPARLNTQLVSAEFFPLLGVRPLFCRTISMDDDRPNAPRVVVLSHHLWQGRFGGAPNIAGRVIQLNDRPAEIIGVMPAGFRFIDADNDLWTAYRLDRGNAWRNTDGRFINVVGRRKTGTTLAETRAEMEGIARRLAAMHEFNKGSSVKLSSLREELTGQVQTSLVVLYGAVAVLLSIACFNVANLLALISGGFAVIGLLLASLGLYGLLAFLVTERTREIGIRMVLGAQTGRVTRSVVGGGLRLVAIGAAIGVAGSLMLLRSLQTLLFGVTPNDAATYASVLALIAAVAALASYLPARRAARVEPLTALRQE
jgi:putative ABC transport system permease protein